MSRNWSRLKPGCGGLNIVLPEKWPLLSPPVSERAHSELSPGGMEEAVGDWPGESCGPPGPTRFLFKHPLVSIIPCFQVVNRGIKPPSPFKVLQTVGRRACRPSGPLFGNVCAHNKPDRQRFIAVFISWGWLGLLLFHHSKPPRHTHTHTRSRVTHLG